MKSHPDVGTDSSCISALPCNSSFCCSVGSGTVFTARTSLHIGRDFGPPAKCFHSDVPSVQTKADTRRAPFLSDRN